MRLLALEVADGAVPQEERLAAVFLKRVVVEIVGYGTCRGAPLVVPRLIRHHRPQELCERASDPLPRDFRITEGVAEETRVLLVAPQRLGQEADLLSHLEAVFD